MTQFPPWIQFIPPWMDATTLATHICCHVNTVDEWVRRGILPMPRNRGGKRMWRWSEVERYLDEGGPEASISPDPEADRIREGTQRIEAERRQWRGFSRANSRR